jgi:hypothetical protein
MALATTIRGSNYEISVNIRNLMLDSDDAKLQRDNEALHQAMVKIDATIESLGELFAKIPDTSDEQKNLLGRIKTLWTAVSPDVRRTAALALDKKGAEAFKF